MTTYLKDLDNNQLNLISDYREAQGLPPIPEDPEPWECLTENEVYHLFQTVPKLEKDIAEDPDGYECYGGALGTSIMLVAISLLGLIAVKYSVCWAVLSGIVAGVVLLALSRVQFDQRRKHFSL